MSTIGASPETMTWASAEGRSLISRLDVFASETVTVSSTFANPWIDAVTL